MSISVVRQASSVVAMDCFCRALVEVRAMFVEGAPVSPNESSWRVAVAVYPATPTRVMVAMVVVALVAQTTAVEKAVEDIVVQAATVEPAVGVVPLVTMAVEAAVAA